MISNRTLTLFIEQSNFIEGIDRRPTPDEFEAHKQFLSLPSVTVPDLQAFVAVIAPGKLLRNGAGMNVRVGSHVAPPGGPEIEPALQEILNEANAGYIDPWQTHCLFESLHPFMDGNGRSGRVLWLWQQRGKPLPPLLFLHAAYYQSLAAFRV